MKFKNINKNIKQTLISHDDEMKDSINNQPESDYPKRIMISIADCKPKNSTITFVDYLMFYQTHAGGQKDLIRIFPNDLVKKIIINYSDLPKDGKFNYITTECYHGTSLPAAKRIIKEGFRVGPGNLFGSGIYFSIGGISIAKNYLKGKPCIIRARVDWGNVAYLDHKIGTKLHGGGHCLTRKALKMGYDSIITNSSFSADAPTVGIILGHMNTFIGPPRIDILELIKP
jgi:hypothetical protein